MFKNYVDKVSFKKLITKFCKLKKKKGKNYQFLKRIIEPMLFDIISDSEYETSRF